MDEVEHEQGYKEFYKGIEFNYEQTKSWKDGWLDAQYENYLEKSNQKESFDEL